MKINIETKISSNYKDEEINIVIKTSKMCQEVENIIEKIQDTSNKIKVVTGRENNNITLVKTSEIIKFYSKCQNNYFSTMNKEYLTKKKMYELEEELDKEEFIRISNSCIVNLNFVKHFDLGITGNITVVLKDNTKENVSKRRISYILKFLKGGDCNEKSNS